MQSEFDLSILQHAITSGRGANCFFQVFIHTLTNQSQAVLDKIQEQYPDAINTLVKVFNEQVGLKKQVNFKEMMAISRELHPLERECLFGPILRHTYNAMFEDKLKHDAKAIIHFTQSQKFANAFGVEINTYMSEEQFIEAKRGMPEEVEIRIAKTQFPIKERSFYHDRSPTQDLKHGKIFELNIVYADEHLNYTLGTRELNNNHNRQIIPERIRSKDGIFAKKAAEKNSAPMAKKRLNFADIADQLCHRFNLTNTPRSKL